MSDERFPILTFIIIVLCLLALFHNVIAGWFGDLVEEIYLLVSFIIIIILVIINFRRRKKDG